MKIVRKEASRERCTEAGWFAYDYILDRPMNREFIESLRPWGSFVYLTMLKRPFFKIESDHSIMKGIEGDDFFRLAVHKDYPEEFEKVERMLFNLPFSN